MCADIIELIWATHHMLKTKKHPSNCEQPSMKNNIDLQISCFKFELPHYLDKDYKKPTFSL